MNASDVAERIHTTASKAWMDSQVMPTDEAVLYLQDALDVCRQLALKLTNAYEARNRRKAEEAAEREQYRVEL